MKKTIIFFCSIFFTILTLGLYLAHLYALPNKIDLPAHEYLVTQQLYSGWAMLGIFPVIAIVFTAFLGAIFKKQRSIFVPVVSAIFCMVIAQLVFWIFTYPANQETGNWSFLPVHWKTLRKQWEYSHATGAILNLLGCSALVVAALRRSV